MPDSRKFRIFSESGFRLAEESSLDLLVLLYQDKRTRVNNGKKVNGKMPDSRKFRIFSESGFRLAEESSLDLLVRFASRQNEQENKERNSRNKRPAFETTPTIGKTPMTLNF